MQLTKLAEYALPMGTVWFPASVMSFLVNPSVIPYDLYCVLGDKGMLLDAAFNSIDGYEHGRLLLQDNAAFFSDYFYHKCREKDFTDPLLLKWL